MRQFFLVAAVVSIACANATAQAYRWVDKEGHVHYTDSPPPPDASKIERKNFRGGGPESANLPYATQVAATNFPVTLYVAADCGASCDDARALLVKRSVPFREINVATREQLDEVKKLSGNTRLPTLLVGKDVQTGFNEGGYNGLLDAAGYPSTTPSLPLEALRKKEPSAPPPAPTPAQAPPAGPGGYEAR